MRNKILFLILTILCFSNTKATAQSATFAQWEQFALHFNPALTGDFDGTLRFQAKHRNQWQSLFRTNTASAEYKFKAGDKRQFSLGFHTLFDKAGASVFKTKTFNLSTSLVQKINEKHSLAIGFNGGLGNNSINVDSLRWGSPGPDPVASSPSVNYADVSVGLNWKYVTDSHFGFHLGAGFLHVNKPDVSFSQNGNSRLSPRLNLHGNIEIPLANRFSLVPSFLYSNQEIEDQLLFGLYSKLYLDPTYAHSFQFGAFAKTTSNFFGRALNIYVLSVSLELKKMLFGFSFERFTGLQRNTFEFSAGYTLGKNK